MSDQRADHSSGSGNEPRPDTEPARATLAGLDDGFVLLDRQWRCTNTNEAAAAARGAGPEELLGRDLRETMPGVAGTEPTRVILRDHPHIRVIGLSMHEGEDLAKAMREAGASAYITKQAASAELAATVRAHASGQPTR